LKLKSEALNALKLPVTVKAGFVGTITLKVPWKSLGKEPVIVLIDRVFVLANPAPDSRTMKEEDREKLFQDKLQQIEEAESATLDAISKSKLGSVRLPYDLANAVFWKFMAELSYLYNYWKSQDIYK
jgi:vacuolar protein sorting-associated protein 13A/C